MPLPRILVVEDETAHRLLIQKALGSQFEVVLAESYSQGKKLIDNNDFDLILLDIMLDEADGFQLCAQIKANERLRFKPIIFLSSRAEVTSKVLGFTLGADDYIVKPCDPQELRVRIQAKLRRMEEMETREQALTAADLVLRLDRQIVEVRDEGKVTIVEFTPLEFKLIYYLARHKEQVLTREQILADVWGQATNVLDRTVDTFIAAIRKKLGSRGKYIRSVHGVGYKFTPDPSLTKRVS